MLPQAPLQRPPAGRMRRQGRACLPRRQRPRTAAEIVPAWRGHAPSLDVSGHSRSAPASRRFRTQGCLMVGQDAGVELFRTADPPAAVAQLVQACQFPCGRAWAAVSDSPAPPPELAIGGTGDRAAPTDSASRLAPAPQPARRPCSALPKSLPRKAAIARAASSAAVVSRRSGAQPRAERQLQESQGRWEHSCQPVS